MRPKAPGIDGRLELPRRVAKTRLENRSDAHTRLLGFGKNVISPLDR